MPSPSAAVSPLPPRPAPRLAALVPAALLAAAAAGACSDQVPLAPRGSRVLLSLAASGSAAGQQLDLRVTYRRLGGEHVPLGALVTPVDTGARRVPLAIDAAPCFRDPDRDTVGVAARAGAATCPIYISAALRDAQNALVDSARVGPLSVAFGDTVSIPPILLRRLVRIVPTPAAVELLVNATAPLTVQLLDAIGEPILGRPIIWAVADSRIASVTPQGLVRGLVPGRTTVTATREGVTAAIPVYVPGVRAMSVTPTTATVIASGSQRLQLALTPEAGLPNTVTWRSSAPAVATVSDSGVVTAVAAGTATITATSVADTAKKASTAITVTRYQGVARWVNAGPTSPTDAIAGGTSRMWATSATNAYVTAGAIYRYDGARWTAVSGNLGGFNAIDGTSPTNAVAVGFGGNAARFDGTQWTAARFTTPEQINDVAMTSPTTAVAVGSTGVVAQLNGATWTVGTVGARDTLFAVWGASPADVWAGGENGSLFRWDGARWSAQPSVGASERVTHIWGTDAANVYLTTWHTATGRGRLLRFDGSAWTPVTLPGSERGYWGLWTVFGSSRNDVYAAADQHLWHFDGARWSEVAQRFPVDYWGLWMRDGWTDGRTVLVAGGNGMSAVLREGASAWTMLTKTPQWEGAWASDPRNVFAVGDWGAIDHFDGTSWRSMSSGTESSLLDVWGSRATDVFAVGTAGTIRRWDGRAWSGMTHGVGALTLRGVAGSGATNVFAVGDGGTILRYDGSAWIAMASPTREALWAVWAPSAAEAFAVGTRGAILRFDGTAWRAMASPVAVDLVRVWGTGPTNVFAGGRNGTVLRYDGTAWRTVLQTNRNTDFWAIGGRAPDDVYVLGCGPDGVQRWDGTQFVAMGTAPCVIGAVVFPEGGAYAFGPIRQYYRGESPNGTIGLGVPAGAAAVRARRP